MSGNLFQGDEVHVPQVRRLGHGPDHRRSLHPAAQHHQREDLRLHLVLVHLPRHHLRHTRTYHLYEKLSIPSTEFYVKEVI